MPLYIKEDGTAALVTKLAKQRGVTKQDTVRQAAQSELDCIEQAVPLRERLGTFRRASKFIWFALADWLRRRNNGRGSGQTQVDRAQRKPARRARDDAVTSGGANGGPLQPRTLRRRAGAGLRPSAARA